MALETTRVIDLTIKNTVNLRTIVGLEIHVQLRTRTKMFCGCPVRYDAAPNSCVCPVCLGHPGALPVINRQAIEYAVLAGLALSCKIARRTKWDRKNYYYPDLPKNYQISQYDMPLAEDGYFEIDADGRTKRIRIRRAHLEEDAGKNIHDASGCTLVDLNRAGTPLLEIVTEPDLASPEEAYTFCTELQRLVTYLGVSEGIMQKGQLRFEPNVNVAIEADGRQYHTPIVDIKNLNSFRAVRSAVAFEAKRQTAAWQEDHDYQLGKRPAENRGWNDETGATEYQRPKEAAHDYRYFPDPDLVPVEISDAMRQTIRESLPELPIARRCRFVTDYGLSAKDAATIIDRRATADLFEEVVAAGGPPDVAAKQFVNVWLKLAHDRNADVPDLNIDAKRMAELARITKEGMVNPTAANRLAEVMLERAKTPLELAAELGLIQVQDTDVTNAWVDQAFAANVQAVQDAIRNPKKARAAVGFLRGQVMKISGGQAEPRLVGELIEKKLAALRSGS